MDVEKPSPQPEPKTLEEFQAAEDAILAVAKGRSFTQEETDQYEGLERARVLFSKSEAIRKTHESVWTAPRVSIAPAMPAGVAKRDSEEYAYDRYLRGLNWRGSDLRPGGEAFAQGEATGAAGGFLMPTTTRDQLIEVTKAFGGLRNLAEVINTTSGNPLQWPLNDDTANSAATSAEGVAAASGGADLVLSQVTLGAFKYDATGTGNLGLKVSNELITDAMFNVVAFVNKKLAIRLNRKMAADYCTGTGTTMATGLFDVTGDASQLTSGVITYVGLQKIVHLLDPSYRGSASWVFNDDVASRIEQVVDTTGRPILIPSTAGISEGVRTTGSTLLGYPVQIDQGSPAWISTYAAAVNTAFLCFGSIYDAFIIRDVQGITVLADPYGLMNLNSMQYFGYARTDSKTQNRKAYVLNG